MTFPLHPRLERIWNGEAGKGEQAERLARAAPGLTKLDLGRVATYGKPRADFASRRSRTVMVGTFPWFDPRCAHRKAHSQAGLPWLCGSGVCRDRRECSCVAPLEDRPPDRASYRRAAPSAGSSACSLRLVNMFRRSNLWTTTRSHLACRLAPDRASHGRAVLSAEAFEPHASGTWRSAPEWLRRHQVPTRQTRSRGRVGRWREAVCDCGGFDTVRYIELAQDVRDVDARSLDADHERVGDLSCWCSRERPASVPLPRAASARVSPPAHWAPPPRSRLGGARSSRARSASSSSSRMSGCAPIRAETA